MDTPLIPDLKNIFTRILGLGYQREVDSTTILAVVLAFCHHSQTFLQHPVGNF